MNEVTKQETKNLIVIKQLPIIEERLREISWSIQETVDEALSLAVTEDTVKEVKARRAALRKTFTELEDKRKAVKSAVMEPYNEFEAVYKKYVTDVFRPADDKLKQRIDEVEDGLKQEKADKAKKYFDEYSSSKNIDFLKFENAGIKVGLTDSLKAINERSTEFIDKVAQELALIETQEHKAEILVEYKRTLNAVQAITTVNDRQAAIEAERQRRQEQEEQERKKAEAQAASEQEQEETADVETQPEPEEEPIEPEPEQEAGPEELEQEEPAELEENQTYYTSFWVVGTLQQLEALKNFLTIGGYEFEELEG